MAKASNNKEGNEADIFSDIKYICQSTNIISDFLQRGCDVAQMSNGDIIITEVKVVSTQYAWEPVKQKMIRASKSSSVA